ncbi:M50 family metallopeptidase [Dolichospermum sp. ST_sed4]|nr:M50 family metallopeptidase [Dolichospermum sp. ST_sed4]
MSIASMPIGGYFHEGLHAIAAKLTGGDVGKIVVSAKEISTEVWCPTTESYLSVLLAPNIIAPIVGFYLMNKGWSEKKGSYVGVGYTTMMMGINPEPFGTGDCYQVVSIITGLSGESATIATIAFLAMMYSSTFLVGRGAYKMEKLVKSKYITWKQKNN